MAGRSGTVADVDTADTNALWRHARPDAAPGVLDAILCASNPQLHAAKLKIVAGGSTGAVTVADAVLLVDHAAHTSDHALLAALKTDRRPGVVEVASLHEMPDVTDDAAADSRTARTEQLCGRDDDSFVAAVVKLRPSSPPASLASTTPASPSLRAESSPSCAPVRADPHASKWPPRRPAHTERAGARPPARCACRAAAVGDPRRPHRSYVRGVSPRGDVIRHGVLCPLCSHTSATVVTGSFVRCAGVGHHTETAPVGTRQEPVVAMVPNPAGSHLPAMPAVVAYRDEIVFGPVVRSTDCGHRYHAGPVSVDAPMCACNIFAIGRCVDCGIWLCGHHGVLYHDKFRCVEHATPPRNRQPGRTSMTAAEAEQHRRRNDT